MKIQVGVVMESVIGLFFFPEGLQEILFDQWLDLIIEMMMGEIAKAPSGVILDGFPRTVAQAEALDKLGARLKQMRLILAYHNHDAELRNAAREFHHMMLGTDPALVTLCLDAHWIYRGAGNSAVALFDMNSGKPRNWTGTPAPPANTLTLVSRSTT